MPTTYNGIGTHYYGRRNLEKRVAVCEHCKRSGTLTSYDTRLWLVVFFLPVIPLGRKRIVNACPACTWHYAIDADKWEAAKQLEISGALENYRTHPTAETAIAAHRELLKFHQSAQAAEFRQVLQQKFGDQAKVHVYLGAAAEHLGQWDEAAASFERALALRPDLPEARTGAALARLRAGRLDEARPLLDFLEQPGAAQLHSLHPLETLARAYQSHARHREALHLLQGILKELPKLADVTAFRGLVEASEKALGQQETLLPERPFTWRRFFKFAPSTGPSDALPSITAPVLAIAGVLLGLVVVGFAISNEYIRRHRTLYIVVGTREPVQVEVRGHGRIRAAPGLNRMVLPEGRHHALVRTAGATEELVVEVRTGYWERWGGKPAWVLNPRGAALLLFREAIYSANPRPGRESFHFGEPFLHWASVTHPFQALPESVQVEKGQEHILTQVELIEDSPVALFNYFRDQQDLPQAEALAQWRLRQHPEDKSMLTAYALTASGSNELSRIEAFLEAGLSNRPVQIEWHRTYQQLRPTPPRADRLRAKYAAMQQAEPTNSALLYLNGRIATNRQEAEDLYRRAIDADANNPYPHYALAQDEIARGDWLKARPFLTQAVALSPNEQAFISVLDSTRLALGETSALEAELQARLQKSPLQFDFIQRLVECQLMLGKTNDAQQTLTRYEREFGRLDSRPARDAARALRRNYLYACGDFDGLLKMASNDRTVGGSNSLFQALVELGRTSEALKLLAHERVDADAGFPMLTLAIAARLAGQVAAARNYREQAAVRLATGELDNGVVAAAVRSDSPPAPAELDTLALPFHDRVVLLTFLAQQHPGHCEHFKNRARKLDVHLDFPHHLVRRALNETR